MGGLDKFVRMIEWYLDAVCDANQINIDTK